MGTPDSYKLLGLAPTLTRGNEKGFENERKKIYLDVRSEPLLHPPLALLGHVQLAEEAQLGHAGPDLSKTTDYMQIFSNKFQVSEFPRGLALGHF